MTDRTAAAHVTIPLALGVVAAGLVGAPLPAAGIAFAALVAAAFVRAPDRGRVVAGAAGAALAAAGLALATVPVAHDHVARQASGARVTIEGRIGASAVAGSRRRLLLDATRVRRGAVWLAVRGRVAVTVAHPQRAWMPGAVVRVRARLRQPRNFGNPGGYDYAGTLARQRILATAFVWDDAGIDEIAPPRPGLRRLPHVVRERVRSRLAAVADPGARAFLETVLLGARGALQPRQRDTLARAGLAHVAAVSGLHVAIVAGAGALLLGGLARRSTRLLRRADVRKLAAWGGLPLALAYAAIAGGHVPATRAVLMYVAASAAVWFDRPGDAVRALAAVACCLLLPMPARVQDPSFALSFTSVLAIVVVLRRPSPRLPAGRGWHWLGVLVVAPLRVTCAAWIATAPLMAHYFQEVSLVAPIANLLLLPLLGPATLLPGLLALPLLPLSGALGDTLLGGAGLAAQAGLAGAAVLAAPAWAAVATPRPSGLELGLCYTALGLYAGRGRLGRRWTRVLAVGLLVAAAGDAGYWIVERALSGRLRVTFLSVGQGDAAVVELPYGRVLVIDGGGLPGPFDPGARVVAPFLRARKIGRVDVIALSHPQHDHYEGLAHLADAFRAREFWSTGAAAAGAGYARLEQALARVGARRRQLHVGDVPFVEGDVRVEVLHPPRGARGLGTNDASLVLRVVHGAVSVLFAGDVEARAERALVAAGMPRSTVLKVPHHGSDTSSSVAFLRAVRPRIAVVSAGYGNRFGFPTPAVVERLAAGGAQVWRTDRDGAVVVRSDGRRVRADGWRR